MPNVSKMPNYPGPLEITPKGIAVFPRIRKPDVFQNEVVGYTIRVKLTPEEIKLYEQKFDALIKEALRLPEFQGKNFSRPLLPIAQEKDGSCSLKFKSKCSFFDRNNQEHKIHINVYDAKKNLIDNEEEIPNGSIVKVAFTPRVFWSSSIVYGVKLSINAVQLIQKASSKNNGKTAEDFGFQTEDGYDYTKDIEEQSQAEQHYDEETYPELPDNYPEPPEPSQNTYSEGFNYDENQNPLI